MSEPICPKCHEPKGSYGHVAKCLTTPQPTPEPRESGTKKEDPFPEVFKVVEGQIEFEKCWKVVGPNTGAHFDLKGKLEAGTFCFGANIGFQQRRIAGAKETMKNINKHISDSGAQGGYLAGLNYVKGLLKDL